MKINKQNILFGLGAILIVVGGVSLLNHNADERLGVGKIELIAPQVLVWDKPKTDAEWAEDVKAENFDIKSTSVLQTMRDAHAAKLERVKEQNKEIVECPSCVKYDLTVEWKKREQNGEILPQPLDLLVEQLYQDKLAQYYFDIEKLTQSIERMDKEIELREKRFVVPDKNADGTMKKEEDLNKISSDRIRKIND